MSVMATFVNCTITIKIKLGSNIRVNKKDTDQHKCKNKKEECIALGKQINEYDICSALST
jgi:hypothetical protein